MWREEDREIFRLAFPAFLTLLAEPLFLLADSAIIGHLGVDSLAGLSIAATVMSILVGLCVFLAYGTTGVVARRVGAGDLRAALAHGVDGLWLGGALGSLIAVLGWLAAPELTGLFDATPEVHAAATRYLQIAIIGALPLLLMLAATGVLRGLQDTRTPLVVAVVANAANVLLNLTFVYGFGWGIAGSAYGTLLAQLGSAIALVWVVVRATAKYGASLRPSARGVVAAGRASIALVVRSLSLQAALALTTYAVSVQVSGRLQAAHLAAHQLTLVIWFFLAYALDAIAIAAQAITGRSIGAGDIPAARAITRRMMTWGVVCGAVLAVPVLVVSPWLWRLFTPDENAGRLLRHTLIIVAIGLPIAGLVFVLDGILIGAGDNTFLAGAQLIALLGYLPAAWLVVTHSESLVALWVAFALGWVSLRCLLLVARQRSDTWLRVAEARG